MISKTAVVYKNVILGKNCTVEDYAIIGTKGSKLKTIIGDNAIIRSHTVIYAGNVIGNNFSTGNKANIRENNQIGNDVSIGTNSVIEHHIRIGDRVRIHSQVFIPEYTILEHDSWLGPNVVITNAKYPKSKNIKKNLKSAYVKSFAILGANATLLPGITIGSRALVGAGSVVVRDIPDGCVVAGNPAKVINKIENLPYI
ncbi:MAG: acetyltransferase [Candidatus Omnitrophica bacterium]|nr:acetyltransferase [Candidatus Omnitrophota bacterium]MCG2708260.1 acetyltransferase [Candidatus Omnitrophota bacterium]